jgi:hypothetical protein
MAIPEGDAAQWGEFRGLRHSFQPAGLRETLTSSVWFSVPSVEKMDAMRKLRRKRLFVNFREMIAFNASPSRMFFDRITGFFGFLL